MVLRKAFVGWLLILGMVLYAVALTAIHVGRSVVDGVGTLVDRCISNPNRH